ncbi:hypothetical protein ACQP2U_22195 [Nocardia sp. CA-084685]|uniref:hypothetical protein n=1 Tax=Nocardia sp. CA-084685 TaxID=3239970 RepID=UPI003D98E469
METGDGKDPTAPSLAVTRWTVGLTGVAIVATGFLIAGLLHEPEPELTTAPVTTTTSQPPDPAENSYVTAPVTFPVQIPVVMSSSHHSKGNRSGWLTSTVRIRQSVLSVVLRRQGRGDDAGAAGCAPR